MNLDEMLNRANPPTIKRDRPLLDDLDVLAHGTQRAGRQRRRGKRLAITGIAAIAIFGTGAAAATSGLLPFSWTSEQGGQCQISWVTVEIAGPANYNQAAFAATTAKQREDILRAARLFLAEYDPQGHQH